MKIIALSSAKEKSSAFIIVVLTLLCSLFVLTRPNLEPGSMLLLLICCLSALLLLGLYLMLLAKAAILIVGKEELQINGIGSYRENISAAAAVQTAEACLGPVRSRIICLLDKDGNRVCTINTLFTAKDGVMAEPAAKALAEALGLCFLPSVEEWLYDKTARANRKEEQKKKKKGIRPGGGAGTESRLIGCDQESPNYDRLDDLR